MDGFNFWYNWLLIASIGITITGLLIAFLPNSVFFAFHTSAIESAFFEGVMPAEAGDLRAFLFGPLGGTISGYFLMQVFIVSGPFKRKEPWAWHAILWPLGVWFVVDSGLSIYHGAFFNVWMINIWTLFLVGMPLLMTRQYFKEGDPSALYARSG